jgi:putative flavoprotein involved in K+ transport
VSPTEATAPSLSPRRVDVLVVGGGQPGPAAGYHLRRAKADFVILDAQNRPASAT